MRDDVASHERTALSSMKWRLAEPGDDLLHPWARAMNDDRTITAVPMRFGSDAAERDVLVTCAPIRDARAVVRAASCRSPT